jgi:hypothetical protein
VINISRGFDQYQETGRAPGIFCNLNPNKKISTAWEPCRPCCLFGFFWLAHKIISKKQNEKLVPVLVIGIAVLPILRGMNLGILIISPLVADLPKGIPCHN